MNVSDLRNLNEATINALTFSGKSTQRNEIISKILQDEACFFKMSKNDAIGILEDIGVHKDRLDYIYRMLISEDSYNKIKNNISKIDLALDIEEIYSVDVFKNKRNNKEECNTVTTIDKKENKIKSIIKKIFLRLLRK